MKVGMLKSLWAHCGFGAAFLMSLSLSMLLADEAYSLPGTTNLAPGGTATATGADFGSSIEDAIDGNRDGNFGNGSVFYANAGAPPLFYEVDLGLDAYIERVQILRRTDADQNIFVNFRLTIFDDDGPGNLAPGASAPGGASARHVRLERLDNNYWLTFAEFEVIGSATPLQFTENENIAAGKPVTTSSAPGYGAMLTSGNDGNINGDFYASGAPVYHSTDYGIGEYWQVDLGAETPLDFLELFARSGSNTTSQFRVSVLDNLLAEVGSVIVDNAAWNSPTPDYDHTIDVSGMTGRYIRVETTREEYLSFAELRAFAAVAPEPSSLALLGVAILGLFIRPMTSRKAG